MTRRDVLRFLGGLLAAAASLPARLAIGTTSPAEPKVPANPEKPVPPKAGPPPSIPVHLRQHFPYLKLEDDVLAAFARAYEAQYGRIDPRGPIAGALLHNRFLLSTDFFPNGADETKPIRFVALYDPYVTPCYNPLRSIGKEN